MKLEVARILEPSSFLPRQYLTLASADHGAEVMKMEAPGIEYSTLSVRGPWLHHRSIRAFEQDGPLAGRPVRDLALEAIAGILSTIVGEDGRLALPAISVADFTGHQGLARAPMAVDRRERTGRGELTDIWMQESVAADPLNGMGPPPVAEGSQQVLADERTVEDAASNRITFCWPERSAKLR